MTAVKFPDISRFSRKVVTLSLVHTLGEDMEEQQRPAHSWSYIRSAPCL